MQVVLTGEVSDPYSQTVRGQPGEGSAIPTHSPRSGGTA